jgi:hypothetical protein
MRGLPVSLFSKYATKPGRWLKLLSGVTTSGIKSPRDIRETNARGALRVHCPARENDISLQEQDMPMTTQARRKRSPTWRDFTSARSRAGGTSLYPCLAQPLRERSSPRWVLPLSLAPVDSDKELCEEAAKASTGECFCLENLCSRTGPDKPGWCA